jgi:hypothetical protein
VTVGQRVAGRRVAGVFLRRDEPSGVELVVVVEPRPRRVGGGHLVRAQGVARQVPRARLAVGERVEREVVVVDAALRTLDLLDLQDVDLGGAGVAHRAVGQPRRRRRGEQDRPVVVGRHRQRRVELATDQAPGRDRHLERALTEVRVDRLLDVPEHVLQFLAGTGDGLPRRQRPELHHRREEELARALEQERELLDLDPRLEPGGAQPGGARLDRRVRRQVRVEPVERVVAVVLDQHLAVDVVELGPGALERHRAAHLAADLGDPREVGHGRRGVGHLVQAQVAQHQIVDAVGKRQPRHRALGAEEHALLAQRAQVRDLLARDVEHRARRVDRDDAGGVALAPQHLDQRVAGAARDVEDLAALRERQVAQQHLAEPRSPDRADLVIVDARQLLLLEAAFLDRHGAPECWPDHPAVRKEDPVGGGVGRCGCRGGRRQHIARSPVDVPVPEQDLAYRKGDSAGA